MSTLKFETPITCGEVFALLERFLKRSLHAAAAERVQDHLATCEKCEEALDELIDRAMARGDLPGITAPPLQMPAALYGIRGVDACDWTKLRRLAGTDASPEECLQGDGPFAQLRRIVSRTGRQLRQAMEFWALPQMAGAPPGGHSLLVRHLRHDGEELGEKTLLEGADLETGPVITAAGEFLLGVSSGDPGWAGGRLVCTLSPHEGEPIGFETRVLPVGGAVRHRAEVRAAGLPRPAEQVAVPLDALCLYLFRGEG